MKEGKGRGGKEGRGSRGIDCTGNEKFLFQAL